MFNSERKMRSSNKKRLNSSKEMLTTTDYRENYKECRFVCIKVHISLSQLCAMLHSEERGVGGVVTPPAIN